jgi:RNA polymerase-binding transcription factor DksA
MNKDFVYFRQRFKNNGNLNLEAMKEKVTETKKTRYSDEELEEFKAIIMDKLAKAREDLKLLIEAYTNNSENDTNDTSPTFKVLEEGQQVLSKEENSGLAQRQERFITNLENALVRIENKTYGICRATGVLISKERLRAVPHATLSMEAKLNQANNNTTV